MDRVSLPVSLGRTGSIERQPPGSPVFPESHEGEKPTFKLDPSLAWAHSRPSPTLSKRDLMTISRSAWRSCDIDLIDWLAWCSALWASISAAVRLLCVMGLLPWSGVVDRSDAARFFMHKSKPRSWNWRNPPPFRGVSPPSRIRYGRSFFFSPYRQRRKSSAGRSDLWACLSSTSPSTVDQWAETLPGPFCHITEARGWALIGFRPNFFFFDYPSF